MKTIFKLALVLVMVIGLSACGERVDVPAAHVAKIMSEKGYKEGTIPTSKFRLDACIWYCDKLVLLSVADTPVSEKMELLMPQDKLVMTFDLRLTLAVNPERVENLFAKIPPQVSESGDIIPLSSAYNTYAQQIIRTEAREMLSEYTIAEVMSSREAINAKLAERLSTAISKQTPFLVRYVGLAEISYPSIIVTAQENAAERRERIQQEEAQLEISKVELERALQEARLQRSVDVEKAKAEAEVNRILGESVTANYIRYRELNALDSISKSDNKVFVPAKMLDSMAGQVQLGRQ